MTFPLDLLIFWPRSSLMMGWKKTRSNGIFFIKCSPIMIIRATQKNIISCPVLKSCVG
jgi:hypothetical protein